MLIFLQIHMYRVLMMTENGWVKHTIQVNCKILYAAKFSREKTFPAFTQLYILSCELCPCRLAIQVYKHATTKVFPHITVFLSKHESFPLKSFVIYATYTHSMCRVHNTKFNDLLRIIKYIILMDTTATAATWLSNTDCTFLAL